MLRYEETEKGSGQNIESESCDEEMKGGEGALTLSERRVVEDGLVYENLVKEYTLVFSEGSQRIHPRLTFFPM